jgi:hypothetical protein
MKLRFTACSLPVSLLLTSFLAGASDDEPSDDPPVVTAEVTALHVLRELDLSPGQLDSLAKLAKGAAAKEVKQRGPGKASAAYRATLTALRDALARGDPEKSADYRARLDELQEAEEPDLHFSLQVSELAGRNAQAALRLLNVRQLGVFIANMEMADPVELAESGLESVRGLHEKEANEETELLADEIAWLVAGKDAAAGKEIKKKVTALLQRARGLKNADFDRQLPDLLQEARKMVGNIDNLTLLTRNLEHGMAEFLSNPQLARSIQAVRRTTPKAKNK